jgi:hypothetical protein
MTVSDNTYKASEASRRYINRCMRWLLDSGRRPKANPNATELQMARGWDVAHLEYRLRKNLFVEPEDVLRAHETIKHLKTEYQI